MYQLNVDLQQHIESLELVTNQANYLYQTLCPSCRCTSCAEKPFFVELIK